MKGWIAELGVRCETAKECFYSENGVLTHLLDYIIYLGEFIHAYTYVILTENLAYPSIFYNSDNHMLYIRRASGVVEIQPSCMLVMLPSITSSIRYSNEKCSPE